MTEPVPPQSQGTNWRAQQVVHEYCRAHEVPRLVRETLCAIALRLNKGKMDFAIVSYGTLARDLGVCERTAKYRVSKAEAWARDHDPQLISVHRQKGPPGHPDEINGYAYPGCNFCTHIERGNRKREFKRENLNPDSNDIDSQLGAKVAPSPHGLPSETMKDKLLYRDDGRIMGIWREGEWRPYGDHPNASPQAAPKLVKPLCAHCGIRPRIGDIFCGPCAHEADAYYSQPRSRNLALVGG